MLAESGVCGWMLYPMVHLLTFACANTCCQHVWLQLWWTDKELLVFLFMLPCLVFITINGGGASKIRFRFKLWPMRSCLLECLLRRCPHQACPSVDNEQHCPEERQRSSKALETTKLQGRFMEVVLGFYWVPWTFSWQLSGGADSSPLLPSPQVTSYLQPLLCYC